MIKNYLKIVFRNVIRQKIYFLINVTGLAMGIATCMLIYLFVNNELSFDRFNAHAGNLYRLVFDYKFPDKLDHLAVASPIAGATVKREFPEVINYTAISPYATKLLVKQNEKQFYEETIYVADSTFFNVFDYKLIRGNKNTVLNEPNTVVINQSTAKKYFGNENPVGKSMKFDNTDGTFSDYKVTGVFEDVPSTSHLVFNMLVSYKTLEVLFGAQGLNSWHNAGSFVYLQLKDNTDVKAFENRITHLYDKYADQYKNVKASISMHLERLTDIHLHSDKLFDVAVKGNNSYVYIFSMVALFLLIIACINYINLATAQGKLRMKEVGVRKVIGASKNELVKQFLFESAFIVVVSVVLSQLFILMSLPAFNHLTGLHLSFFSVYSAENLLMLSLLSLFIILIAGLYPAFYLTSPNPVMALKSNTTTGEKGITLRKALVVVQFTISIVLISSTLIVRDQVGFMLNHDPGFNKNNVLAIRFQDTLIVNSYPALKNELLAINGVKDVAQTCTLPGDPPDRKITRVEGSTAGSINEIPVEPIWIDPDYFKLMQIQLNEGRMFDEKHTVDFRESFVVNESAAKKFNWKECLGKKIIWGNGPRQREGKVIGVVKDIYTGSLKNEVEPIIFVCDKNPSKVYTLGYLLVRTEGNDGGAVVKQICNTFSRFDKAHPVDYKFIGDNLSGLYSGEEKTNSLFQYLSVLTIIIACLGLFGLVSFSISQRIKEIGVRKVLGASASAISVLLSKDFLKLVFVSLVIAVPICCVAMHYWLQGFAFRVSIHWWIFLVSGLIAFMIALLTISFQAIRAAMTNPVKSLRTE